MMNVPFLRRIQIRIFWLLLTTLGMSAGCVSVNIPSNKPERSKVSLNPPVSPFQKSSMEGSADGVWRNPRTGNNISYLTQCGDKADPDLESIRSELALGLSDYRVISSSRFDYNSREALRSTIAGKVDGIDTKMDVVVFKKNGCIYTLTLVGLAPRLQEDVGAFDKFISGFQAP
jgi:hypothetical protein